jgi:hypothetical protein
MFQTVLSMVVVLFLIFIIVDIIALNRKMRTLADKVNKLSALCATWETVWQNQNKINKFLLGTNTTDPIF